MPTEKVIRHTKNNTKSINQIIPKGYIRVIKLAVDADFEWWNYYGNEWFSEIANLVFQTNKLYQTKGFPVYIKIVYAHVWKTDAPYSEYTIGAERMSGFRQYWNKISLDSVNRNLFHHFTRKKITFSNGGVMWGAAHTFGINNPINFGYAVSYSGTTTSFRQRWEIVAHEIGHNFGGGHNNTACEGGKNVLHSFITSNTNCINPVTLSQFNSSFNSLSYELETTNCPHYFVVDTLDSETYTASNSISFEPGSEFTATNTSFFEASIIECPTDSIVFTETTATDSVAKTYTLPTHHFNIYPNPATNTLNIEVSQRASIQIHNTQGRIIDTFEVNKQTQYNADKLPNGIYYLQINIGQQQYTRQIAIVK